MNASATAPEGWDRWLADAGHEASFTQTSAWASIHRAVNGVAPHWVEVRNAGRRVGGALFGLRAGHVGSARGLMLRALGSGGGTLECVGGPVLLGSPAATLQALLQEIDVLAQRVRAHSVVFVNPPSTASWTADPAIGDVFCACGYAATPWATSLVDIARDDDALLASFRASARKGIRKCRELGVTVRACRDRDDYLANFSRPLFATRAALGMEDDPAAAEREWWDWDTGGNYRYFLAENPEGTVLGTLGTYRWNGVATEIMSERTMPARAANLPVQDLLHWHAFVSHRETGDTLFDLAGFAPANGSAKEEGIRAFKEKWCGRTVPIPRYTRDAAPAALRVARTVRRFIDGRALAKGSR